MPKLFTELNLSKQLQNALNDLGFQTATAIQDKAYPIILSGRDAVGIAQTGTGKTFAYLLPILRQLNYSTEKPPRVLILVPTRELVAQAVENCKQLAKYMNIRVVGIYGGSNINTQRAAVTAGLDILVATPGRLIDLASTKSINLNNIKKLVIDEVDEMLNLGFRAQLMQVIERLPLKRQSLLFSATLSEDVETVIKSSFIDPVFIETVERGTPLERIKQSYYETPNFYSKLYLFNYLLNTHKEMSKVLLFVRNKTMANYLEQELPAMGHPFGVIHSNKTQPYRFEMVKKFGDGEIRVLVATDVIARGLDLRGVSHVINFDFPEQAETYIHRIGRTGRAEEEGNAISFVIAKQFKWLDKVEALMKMEVEEIEWPSEIDKSLQLLPEEEPVKKIKGKVLKSADASGGAFHEKKAKNSKLQFGGKRKQETLRRKHLQSLKLRKR